MESISSLDHNLVEFDNGLNSLTQYDSTEESTQVEWCVNPGGLDTCIITESYDEQSMMATTTVQEVCPTVNSINQLSNMDALDEPKAVEVINLITDEEPAVVSFDPTIFFFKFNKKMTHTKKTDSRKPNVVEFLNNELANRPGWYIEWVSKDERIFRILDRVGLEYHYCLYQGRCLVRYQFQKLFAKAIKKRQIEEKMKNQIYQIYKFVI